MGTGLDRNTRESLNKLKAIFDKTKAEERKQLVEEMSIVGNEAIHELAARNGWGEGSIEKTALHGLLGAMTSKAAGGSALAGILSGGVQEYAMGYLHNHMPKGWVANHPDEVQMIAAGLGMIVGNISNDKKIGGYIAQMGAKWNDDLDAELYDAGQLKKIITGDVDYTQLKEQTIEQATMTIPESTMFNFGVGEESSYKNNNNLSDDYNRNSNDINESNFNEGTGFKNIEHMDAVEHNNVIPENMDKWHFSKDYKESLRNAKKNIFHFSNEEPISIKGEIGTGLGGNFHIGPVVGELSANGHIEFSSSTSNPVLVGQIGGKLNILKKYEFGLEERQIYDPKTKRLTEESPVRIGHNSMGIDYYDDLVISFGGNLYLGAGGGVELDINLNAAARYIRDFYNYAQMQLDNNREDSLPKYEDIKK